MLCNVQDVSFEMKIRYKGRRQERVCLPKNADICKTDTAIKTYPVENMKQQRRQEGVCAEKGWHVQGLSRKD